MAKDNAKFLADCTPGRANNEGHPDQRSARNNEYGPGPIAMFKLLTEWREAGTCAGLTFE